MAFTDSIQKYASREPGGRAGVPASVPASKAPAKAPSGFPLSFPRQAPARRYAIGPLAAGPDFGDVDFDPMPGYTPEDKELWA